MHSSDKLDKHLNNISRNDNRCSHISSYVTRFLDLAALSNMSHCRDCIMASYPSLSDTPLYCILIPAMATTSYFPNRILTRHMLSKFSSYACHQRRENPSRRHRRTSFTKPSSRIASATKDSSSVPARSYISGIGSKEVTGVSPAASTSIACDSDCQLGGSDICTRFFGV